MNLPIQKLTILGSTGSIGVSTLDVLARHPQQFQVFALTAKQRVKELALQCQQFHPRYAVLGSQAAAEQLRTLVASDIEVLWGEEGLALVAAHEEVDTVMAAIVGAAGLLPTLAAVQAGKKVLLANKEALVMAGHLFMDEVVRAKATLLPIDSEHNAIFQCLPADYSGREKAGVRRLLLSASGGPFRTTPLSELAAMTPDQACAHPNWAMGRKISVDSATMMNKGLELIEASWLFAVDASDIDIVIHPQSIIHSLVEYKDGSVLAQLGNPDMRTPIAHALAWPERIESGVSSLDLIRIASLNFEAPDEQRFPALGLARAAATSRGDAPAALNAANEVAVEAFLNETIGFTRIAEVVDRVMQAWPLAEPRELAAVQEADKRARAMAQQVISQQVPTL
ncbi:MAG: 1-deoxy-D-xylulose-5-phosphate reductoisomerase [Gammaproteobacteria bacterium]|nr:1-deoxy-D-xylulose-5-phosphate reductoisomerase [Gammaproteobacteria bacterium]MBQ0839008.1 1-deoxy-D-xylulose-5-phosphate reductoisomerase [Gammaproteobacteria bacterium]